MKRDNRPAMHLARYGFEGVALCGVTHVSKKPEIAFHDETCSTCLDKRAALRQSKRTCDVLTPLVGVFVVRSTPGGRVIP